MDILKETKFSNINNYREEEILEICYTFKCNSNCAHCSYKKTNSTISESIDHVMSTDQVINLIKTAKQAGKKYIEFLGGEPFLNIDELSIYLDAVYREDMNSGIITNGFWGQSLDYASFIINSLKYKSLTHLLVSIDTFHQKFIPIEKPLNVVRAAQKENIDFQVLFVKSNNPEKDKEIINKIKSVTEYCAIIEERDYYKEKYEPNPNIIDICPGIIPCILPNGETTACAANSLNNDPIKDTILYIGNCFTQDALEILNKNHIVRLRSFFDQTSDIYYKKLIDKLDLKFEPKNYSNFCLFCRDVLSNKKIDEIVRNYQL